MFTYYPEGAKTKIIQASVYRRTESIAYTTGATSWRIKRELGIRAALNHANIVPIYGYTYSFSSLPAIVTPFAENGSLVDYLEREGAALTLVRRFQLAELQYGQASRATSFRSAVSCCRSSPIKFLIITSGITT